jgi:hypothetical protein
MVFRFLTALIVSLLLSTAFAETEAPDIYTPAVGTDERKAILDTLRAELKRLHGLDVVFVVVTMNVTKNWAWLHTRPQSEDGSSKYEDVTALLRKSADGWGVVEMPCGDVQEIDSCGDVPPWLEQLRDARPAMSPAPSSQTSM